MQKAEQEALLNAITQRVIELDHHRRNDAQLDQTVKDYIDALHEVTTLDRQEIENIARQVVRDRQSAGMRVPAKWLWGVAVLVLMLALLLVRYIGFKEGVTAVRAPDAIPGLESRAHIVRAHLGNVLAQLNSVKLYVVEHCLTYGKCPETFAAMGLEPEQWVDDKTIKAIELTAEGGIAVTLGSVFGANEKLLLQSDALEFNNMVKWQCFTTIEQRFLGSTEAAPCNHRAGL